MTNSTRQYGKMFLDLLDNLKPNQVVAYTLAYDRMNSSVTRKDFYDKKEGRHYVIIPLEELAKKLHTSEKTAGKVIKSLAKIGYLTIKQQFSKANKIFIPDFDEGSALSELDERAAYNSITEDFTGTQRKNVPSNQSTLNQTNTKTVNTINTGKSKKTKKVVQNDISDFDVSSWIDSTVSGYSMDNSIPETVAKYSHHFSKNTESFCKNTIHVISKVRSHIVKKFGIQNSEKSQFDSNKNFGAKLATALRSIFNHAIANKIESVDGVMKYLNKSLQSFFTSATGNAMAVARPAYAPSMESNNVLQSAKTKKTNSYVPEWLDEPKDAWKNNQPKVTEEDRRRVKEMLKHFE